MPKKLALPVAAVALLGLAPMLALLVSPSDAEARGRGSRRTKVTEIIVHATGGPFCRSGQVAFSPSGTGASIKKFFEASGSVSIHYIVDRDGRVLTSVPEDEIAIHAVNHNDRSVGIELINNGDGRDPYPAVQIEALAKLVQDVQQRWRIPLSEVKGHEDVDRSTFSCGGREARRKQDPGPLFPWDRLKLQLLVADSAGQSTR